MSDRPHRTSFVTAPTAVLGSIALAIASAPAAHAAAGATAPAAAPAAALRALPQVSAALATGSAATAVGSLAAAAAAATAKKLPATHTVRAGDTVSAIAAKYGLRTADVLAWNSLGWKSVIHPGDKLVLSAKGMPSTSQKPATTQKPASGVGSSAGSNYTVKRGDTLWGIANKNGVSVAALKSANRLSGAMIHPGQKLTIPGKGSTASSGSSGSSSSSSKPVSPSSGSGSSSSAGTHAVASGDTLWAIANRHDVSLSRLLAANGLGMSSIIYPGQKLTIPGSSAPAAKPDAEAPAGGSASVQLSANLDAEQKANARIIISVGRELNVPDRGIAIALATAMVESRIRNVDYGTYDSVGLFQQRPSTGWGTVEQAMDARRATAAFFGGPSDPNGRATRGLLDIKGWHDLGFGEAAQAVQISAFPDRYGQWEVQAFAWVSALG